MLVAVFVYALDAALTIIAFSPKNWSLLMPLVSVVLPTYSRNASGLLRKAIESVLAQDMPDLELLVVDDGSTDGSAKTIAELAATDSRVKHIRFDKNVGLPAYTTGEAFRQSAGEYIAWQFDDCEWKPYHLSSLLKLANDNPDAAVFYGKVHWNNGSTHVEFGENFNKEKLLTNTNIIPNCSTLIRRKVYETVGWVDPSVLLKRTNDLDLWIRASKEFEFIHLPRVVAVENGVSLSDSLGNSVSLASSLSLKYSAHDRNKYLNISNFDQWTPYSPPEWMNEEEKEEYAFIAFEHYLRIDDISNGCKAVETAIPKLSGDGQLSMQGAFKWFSSRMMNEHRRALLSHGDHMQEQLKHINTQQIYIDQQQLHIDKQQALVDQLQTEIDRLSLALTQKTAEEATTKRKRWLGIF